MINVKKKHITVKKSSIAVIIGFTILFGSNPYLKAKWFNNVEQGMDIIKVIKIVINGIRIRISIGKM